MESGSCDVTMNDLKVLTKYWMVSAPVKSVLLYRLQQSTHGTNEGKCVRTAVRTAGR